MLLIATPKSASTSLMRTLAERLRLPAYMGAEGVGRESIQALKPSPGFQNLHAFHGSDFKELSADVVRFMAGRGCVYKVHAAPTPHNRRLLADAPKVLLHRAPREIVTAWRRAVLQGIHHRLRPFDGLQTEGEWLARAEAIGVIGRDGELERFRDGWLGEDVLEIRFRELVADPDRTIREIERHWGFESPAEPVILAREKYTRGEGGKKTRSAPRVGEY
ncbi:hypothetical protein DPQ33_07335 [Oceanidesulfovibrio indonesiensis]|uniref:Sulfotransferase family protein n=1 Tax=Oceanidesulfovibrio indonesiensis TaxID=54767 RepID=A0A7M3MFM1_9BACT|nr:sulfotransferase [Oceanidesulfovibrio indonesiensis]TVM17915.1 hypothetical protein DPQ33_07335 [Oceanidesulfovibrio indonesiensis]